MLNSKPWRLAALAAVFALSACDGGPEIVPAGWVSQPSASDIAQAYPDFARMAQIPGKVKLRCDYTLEGVLERCRKLGVAPAGLQFDRALPRLLALYQVRPQTYDGQPAPSPIEFVIAFNPPPAPPPYAGPPVTETELAAVRRTVSLIGRVENQMAQQRASRSVDLDRMTPVAGMVDRAFAAEGDARDAATMRALVQAMTPGDRRELSSSRSYMALPNRFELERVSPEYHAANRQLATRMRTEYCAAYACDATLPGAAPAAE